MRFEHPLKRGILLKRYKRFLADIRLPDGSEITAHCPNSGSMRSCSEPGSQVCYSRSENPGRKYPHTLEMVYNGKNWIGINTSRTNAIVVEALEKGRIKELTQFTAIRREVKTSPHSRLDLMIEKDGKQTFIEIKNCSLVEKGCALFPDAVTSRGTKHLHELSRLVSLGHRGVILFLIQRQDCDRFAAAATIDPLYAATLAEVYRAGVEILAYQAEVTPESVEVITSFPVNLDG